MLSLTSPHHFQTLLLHKNPKFLQKSNHANRSTIRSISSSSLEVDSNDSAGSVTERGLDAVSIPFPSLRVAKRVVLVRHGQSTWNEEGRIQGSSNFSVLTKKGESQAELSRQMLIDDSFDVCFSSPLTRSRRTAEVIWDSRKTEVITDPDLREIDLYSFQGLLKHEGKAMFGEAFSEWQLKPVDFNIDGHYPVRELWARARSCWNKIIAHEGESILVVAHNAVNQALIATAMGLGSEYFRILVQSNCGVSVLDFTPRSEGCSPYICLNRLNQTPSSPIAGGNSGGRITTRRMVLVCHGSSQSNTEADLPNSGDERMTMLGIIQSQKTAELLLDLKVSSVFSSPRIPSVKTATSILRVQEAAHTLVADCAPRYVDMKQIQELDVETILQKSRKESVEAVALHPGWLNKFDGKTLTKLWDQAQIAWQSLLKEVSEESNPEKVIVVVGHPALHCALLGHCLNLTKERIESFHLDAGSITVIDFPDGPCSQGVIRCVNYTSHLGRWSIPITKSPGDSS